MATPAQIAANRLNAQKSTGPRSVEGKSVSRFNNLKSGIYATVLVLPGEDPAELEALAESCRLTYQPVGQDETDLVDQLIESSWTQRRLARLEAEILTQLMADESLPKNGLLGAAFAKDFQGAKMIQVIFREKHAAKREWHKAFSALLRLQEQRLREQTADQEQAVEALERKNLQPEPPVPAEPNWVRSANSPKPSNPYGQPRKIATLNPAKQAQDDRALRL